MVGNPKSPARRILVLLEHLPPDSPLARSVGPEWWWQRDVHAQMLANLLDAVSQGVIASAMTPLALGAKPKAVEKALTSSPLWPRPYEPPKPPAKPLTFEQRVRRMLAAATVSGR